MDTIEVSGRTIEEAVKVAAAELGVSVDAVEYEVLEEGTKGFLGLGQIPCMIRAKVKEGYEAGARPEPARAEAPPTEEREEERPEEIEAEAAVEVEKPEAKPKRAEEKGAFEQAVVNMLKDVIKAMDLDATPVVKAAENDEVVVEIVGKDIGILIGRRGQTLDALQYLMSIGANRRSSEKKRLILDAEGYRERHKRMLEKTAHEYATAVKAQGQEAELEPQSARDRRIVHMALANDPDVYTYSEGEGENRHVVISPKK